MTAVLLLLLLSVAAADEPADAAALTAQLEEMLGKGPPPKAPEDLARPFTVAPLVVRADGNLIGVTGERLRITALEHARELGWPALGADNLLFGEDRSGEAELVLGGEVQRIYEADVLGDSGWVVEVRWEVLDRRADGVVYSVLTRFIYQGSWDDTDEEIDARVIRGSLERVLRRPAFADLLRATGPATTEQDGELTLSRCTDPPPALPQGMDDVVARTVFVQTPAGTGSGVVLSPDGFVLTAAHVVASGAPTVRLEGGMELEAELIRIDTAQDAALLKIPGAGHKCLQPAPEPPSLGGPVFLVGYPLGELSVSSGVVSGVRSYEGHAYVQTDAASNPGGSGGPLLDAEGRLVGILSWKVSLPDVEGVAFAVPPDAVADALQLDWGDASDAVTAVEIPELEPLVDAPDPDIEDMPTGRLCLYRAADPITLRIGTLRVRVGRLEVSMSSRTWTCAELPYGSYTTVVNGRAAGSVTIEEDEDVLAQVVPGDPTSPLIHDRVVERKASMLPKVQGKFSQVSP